MLTAFWHASVKMGIAAYEAVPCTCMHHSSTTSVSPQLCGSTILTGMLLGYPHHKLLWHVAPHCTLSLHVSVRACVLLISSGRALLFIAGMVTLLHPQIEQLASWHAS